MSNQTQEAPRSATLDFMVQPVGNTEQAFAEFHRANPHVYMAVEELALRAHKAGVQKLGIGAITETLRYSAALQTVGDAYKINNNYRPLYARMLLADHPELSTLLNIRERTSASPYRD